jgi:hypothetical protein
LEAKLKAVDASVLDSLGEVLWEQLLLLVEVVAGSLQVPSVRNLSLKVSRV